MLRIVQSGCQQQKADAAAGMSINVNPDLPSWSAPSCKDWNNTITIAIRIAAVLDWLQHPPVVGVQQTTSEDMNNSSQAASMDLPQSLLLQTLLQILDRFLTGKILWLTTLLSAL